MDLHQIGPDTSTATTTTGGGSYLQQHQQSSTSTSSSSSSSPSAKLQYFHRHQRQEHHHLHQQPQLYSLLTSSPQSTSHSPSITTLPPIPTSNNTHYLDKNDEQIGSSSSWPRSKEFQTHQHPQHHHHHQQQQQQLQQPQFQSNVKTEIMGKNTDGPIANGNGRSTMDDSMPSTSDFVKKLYKMLEDPSFQNVVCWGPLGDCFVVKDMNEFTKSILPRMFKHSNFASFVRQLNKYDFHKVKNTDDNLFGEHSWTFRHPDFHADRREALENIKRKVPAPRKNVNVPNSTTTALSSSTNHHHSSSSSPSMHHNPHSHHTPSPYPLPNHRSPSPSQTYSTPTPNSYRHHHHHLSTSTSTSIKQEISELKSRLLTLESNYETRLNNLETNYESRLNHLESGYESRLRLLEMRYEGRIRGLEKNYETVLVEMVGFQRGVAQQDGVVKSLMRCFLGGGEGGESERDRLRATSTMTASRHLTTMSASGLVLPSVSTSGRIEDGRGQGSGSGQYQRQSQDQNQTSSHIPIPFLPSQSQPMPSPHPPLSDTPSLSDRPFLPQDGVQRTSTTNQGGNENGNENVGWGSRSGPSSNRPIFIPVGEDDEDSPSPSSSSLMTHGNEALQVYTVGHLMPRNTDDRLGSWSLDTSGFSSGDGGTAAASAIPNTSSKDLEKSMYAASSSNGGDRNEDDGDNIIRPPGHSTQSSSPSSSLPMASSSSSSSKKLRVRRSTFVPGNWAVSPRVLLVDDDEVIRKLSSKFLKIFGCTTDVAVDGIGAVTKMNLEKYDLVLMDILMPKLDGISATNLIRKFDRGTPIISMTVNSKPNEIMEYYSSGMNDILPKPFTKEGLLVMLEKHLVHLKVMQQMTVVPRSVGVPPLSDANFEQVLMTNAMMVQQQQRQHSGQGTAGLLVTGNTSDALSAVPPPLSLQQQQPQISFTSLLGVGEDDGRINPLAGMGLSDEQYNTILQNLVNGERFMGMGIDGNGVGVKRTIDDVGFGNDERRGKRGRFEGD